MDYWRSREGILERLAMLANDVELSTFNNAVKVYGKACGATDFQVSGNLKQTSCQWCINHVGVIYHKGQFMPDLPRHPGCPHFYNILSVG